jgi:mannose-1-phosphate guanylyltransferase
VERLASHVGTNAFDERVAAEYEALERISIDYAVMEKADNILMARGTFDWDDVGSWPSLANHFAADADANVVVGRAATRDAGGNIVYSPERVTALLGVKDLVVVQAGGVTLVCPRSRSQDIKGLVRQLAGDERFRELL